MSHKKKARTKIIFFAVIKESELFNKELGVEMGVGERAVALWGLDQELARGQTSPTGLSGCFTLPSLAHSSLQTLPTCGIVQRTVWVCRQV
jgi:hypothetical protein